MSRAMLPQCYSIYVEKELVGKRLKSSKVKVSWQLAFEKEYIVHHVELRHSVMSGKREILIDGVMVFANKSMFSGTFEHHARIAGGHEVKIVVIDSFEGYTYDLVCDHVQFHKLPRKSIKELEMLRNEMNDSNVPVISADFASFTGKSSALLDGAKAFNAATLPAKKREEEANLLDWDLIQVSKPPPPPPVSAPLSYQQQQPPQAYGGGFNPFDAPPPQQQYAQYSQYQQYPQAAPPPQQQQQPQQYQQYQQQAPPPQYQQYQQQAQYQQPSYQQYQQPQYDMFASSSSPPPVQYQSNPFMQTSAPPPPVSSSQQQQQQYRQPVPYDPFG